MSEIPHNINTPVQVTACPACDHAGGVPIGLQSPGFPADFRDSPTDLLHPDYDVLRCPVCSLHYKSARMSNEALGRYYDCLPFEQFETDYLMHTDREVVRLLREAPKGARMLDYGCGVGRILEASGRASGGCGVEINERSAAIAARKGIRLVTESELRQDFVLAFDFIIMTDVYEHLVRPIETLRLLASCLKPGGKIIIATGNAEAFPPGPLFGQFWYFRLPGHLQVLSPAHAVWCATQLGLCLESCKTMSHYDVSIPARIFQSVRDWVFRQFRLHPQLPLTQLLKIVPLLRRARRWSAAPAVYYMRDHLVAVLVKN